MRAISPGEYNVALVLSVLHHITHKNGLDYTTQLIAELMNRIPILILELANREENVRFAWRNSLPREPLAILARCGNVKITPLAPCPSHLSNATRPMYMISN